jgi:uncharacterized protein (DUF433 family)
MNSVEVQSQCLVCYHASTKEFVMDYTRIITIEPDKRSGKACIRGLRMTVTDVLEYLAGGMTPEEIVAEFPDLSLEDIRACLAFAAEDFSGEMESLRKNHEFLAILDSFKNEKATVSPDEVEERLR